MNGETNLHRAARRGDEDEVRALLSKGVDDIDVANAGNETPVVLAAESGHENIVRILLEEGANVNVRNKNGETLLCIAVKRQSLTLVDLILSYSPDIINESDKGLLKVAGRQSGDQLGKIIDCLLQHGFRVTVNVDDKADVELLHAAIENGYCKLVEEMLKFCQGVGVLVNSRVKSGGVTPLLVASKKKQKEMVQLLIGYGADVNARCTDESSISIFDGEASVMTPVDCSIQNDDLEITRILLSNQAKVRDHRYLSAAVQKRNVALVELLVQHGADVNAADEKGRTALHVAVPATARDAGTLYYFVSRMSSTPENKAEMVKALIRLGADVNARDKSGKAPFCYSVVDGDLDITKILLSNNANLRRCSECLTTAVFRRRTELVELLLQHGADPNVRTKKGIFLMDAVLGFGQEGGVIAKLLLKYGADINVKNSDGNMLGNVLLTAAISKGDCRLVKALLEYGADFTEKKIKIATVGRLPVIGDPLCMAVRLGNASIVTMLLDKGANVNTTTLKRVTTPLHLAVFGNNCEVVKVILKHPDVKINIKHPFSPLHWAAAKNYTDIVQALLNNGADVHLGDSKGITPLHRASESGHMDVVKLLVEYGAEVNDKDDRGKTPLHYAVVSPRMSIDVVSYLLAKGADVDCKDTDGNTPLFVLSQEMRPSIAEVLFDYGADFSIEITELPNPATSLKTRMHHSYFRNAVICRHVVKLLTANKFSVNDSHLELFKIDGPELDDFRDKCESELAVLRNVMLGDCNLSYVDFLTCKLNSLVAILKKDGIADSFKSDFKRTDYPIYGGMMEYRFRMGEERVRLLDNATVNLKKVFSNWPDLCIDALSNYLRNVDLKVFIEACEPSAASL